MVNGPLYDRRVAITGGSGFLAWNLVPRLADVHCQIMMLSRRYPVDADVAVRGAGTIHRKAALREPAFWEALVAEVDVVFHFAAQTSLYEAEKDPLLDWHHNVLPMLLLLEASRKSDKKPLILFAGTCTQFGLVNSLPVSELTADAPVTIYDQHKLAAEKYLEHYVRRDWARGATLRLANVYGPGPPSGSADRGVLNMMIRRALKGEALTLYGNGERLRDYIFVKDAVEAFVAAAAAPEKVNGRHFVVCSGESKTLAEVFQLVADRVGEATGKVVSVISVPRPSTLLSIEDRDFVGDSGKLRECTGWMPLTNLSSGIEETLRFYTQLESYGSDREASRDATS